MYGRAESEKVLGTRLFFMLVLVAVDALVLILIMTGLSELEYGARIPGALGTLALAIVCNLLAVYLFGGYVLRRQLSFIHIPAQMGAATGLASVIILVVGYAFKLVELDPLLWRTVFLYGMLLFGCWLVLSRLVLAYTIRWFTVIPTWYVWGDSTIIDTIREDVEAIYGEQDVQTYSGTNTTQEVAGVIALPGVLTEDKAEQVVALRMSGIRVFTLEEYYEKFLYRLPVRLMSNSWFATSADFGLLHQEIPLRIKRTIDVLGALIGLLLLGWLMLLISVLVKLQDKGSAIYKQRRVGVNGRSFSLYKFRTMVVDAEKDGAQWTAKGDSRITWLGRYLRAARLDELPQLFNVLRGDMSLIGPRPERPSFVAQLEKKIPFYSYRHAVKPGITGWAQVMYPYGASEEDAERKLEYDLYYIRHFTLMLDMFIVLRTLRVVLFGKGR